MSYFFPTQGSSLGPDVVSASLVSSSLESSSSGLSLSDPPPVRFRAAASERVGADEQVTSLLTLFAEGVLQVRALLRTLGGEPASKDGQHVATELTQKLNLVVRTLRGKGATLLLEPELVAEVCYALVALADEWLIYQVDWIGREQWSAQPLERSVFGSCLAGRLVFSRIAHLGERRLDSETSHQLAAVYLLTLMLGFCGEWREDQRRLETFRQRLRQCLRPNAEHEPLFPQAYQHCSSRSQEQRLAPLRTWWLWCAAGLGAYLLLGIGVWLWLTSSLIQLVERLGG